MRAGIRVAGDVGVTPRKICREECYIGKVTHAVTWVPEHTLPHGLGRTRARPADNSGRTRTRCACRASARAATATTNLEKAVLVGGVVVARGRGGLG